MQGVVGQTNSDVKQNLHPSSQGGNNRNSNFNESDVRPKKRNFKKIKISKLRTDVNKNKDEFRRFDFGSCEQPEPKVRVDMHPQNIKDPSPSGNSPSPGRGGGQGDPWEDEEPQVEDFSLTNFMYEKVHYLVDIPLLNYQSVPYRKVLQGRLPSVLIQHLQCNTVIHNTMLYVAYLSKLQHDPIVKACADKFIDYGYVSYTEFVENFTGFWFSDLRNRADHQYRVSNANSTFIERERASRRNIDAEHPVEPLLLQLLKGPLYTGLKWTLKIYILYRIFKYVRNRWYQSPHGASCFPMFPRFSMYLEELLKCVPGAWWLIAKFESFMYGNTSTYWFHSCSKNLSFKNRLLLHRIHNFHVPTPIAAPPSRTFVHMVVQYCYRLLSQLPFLVRILYLRYRAQRFQHSLLPFLGKYSVYIEELIKCLPYGWLFIACAERLLYGDWKTYNFHKLSSSWSYKKRVQQHLSINTNVSRQNSTIVRNFKLTTEHFTPLYEPNLVEIWQPNTSLPPITLSSPVFTPTIPVSTEHFGTNRNPERRRELPRDSPGIYPLFYGFSNFAAPANTFDNLAAAVSSRVLQWNNVSPQLIEKNIFRDILNKFYHPRLIDNPNWYNELDARQKLNFQKTQTDLEKGIIKEFISISIKTDEIINCGGSKFVPRVLCHLQGLEFYQMGKMTSELTHGFASDYDSTLSSPFVHKGVSLVVYYTCGATSFQLDTAINNFIVSPHRVLLMVMGDDTLALIKNNGSLLWFICDFSRMDRTHSSYFRGEVNRLIGKTFPAFAKLREEMYQRWLKPLINKKHTTATLPALRLSNGKKVDMLLTGEPGTSLFNSITNSVLGIDILTEFVVSGCPQNFDFEGKYLRYGFTCKKPRLVTSNLDSDYLKGVILNNDDGYHWVRLPSFLCKFGKVLTHPSLIIKESVPYDEKCRKLLYAQWLGYGNMRTNWFYSALDNVFKSMSIQYIPDKLQSWQVTQSEVYISDDVWNSFMRSRYKISIEEMQDFVTFVSSLRDCSFPVVYTHSLLLKLGEVDY